MSVRSGQVGPWLAWAAVLVLAAPAAASAQSLTLTQYPVNFPQPTAANYDAGTLSASTPLGFSVGSCGILGLLLTSTISIRAASSTLSGGKPVSHVEWRRLGTTTWSTLSTTYATVASNPCTGWSGSIEFRISLSWTGDPPQSQSVVIQLRQT